MQYQKRVKIRTNTNFQTHKHFTIMTTQSSNILLVLANAVANFNGSMSDVRSAANILVSNLGINGFTTQTMGVLVPFKKSLVDLGFNAELVNNFMSSLGVICDCKDKAIGKYTKQHIATIKSFLQFAAEKHAAAQQPTNEPAATEKHPILAKLDECLNAQVAAAQTVAVANNGSEFANVENAAAKAGVSLGDYFSLYGDAGWELDFEPMQLEQLQDIYAAAKEQDGDDDDKNSADELVEKFARFVYDKLCAAYSEMWAVVGKLPLTLQTYKLDFLPNYGFSLLVDSGVRLKCANELLMDGEEVSGNFFSLKLNSFDWFLSDEYGNARRFFRDILRKIE